MKNTTTRKIRETKPCAPLITGALVSTIFATGAWAESGMPDDHKMQQVQIGNMQHGMGGGHHAGGRAPVGLMGKHMHKKGEWMLSYRFMQMGMSGNISGTGDISADTIATTVPNIFAAMPGQPPTLRVVPTKMTTDMHMFGAMYAPSNDLNLMAMIGYIDKSMDMTTYAGAAGTAVLGTNTVNSSGFGDAKLGGLYRLYDDKTHHVHLNFGVSLPTGAIDKRGTMLAPSGATPNMRLAYGAQLGTGTFDFMPGITYTARRKDWSWGAQYRGEMRMESANSEGYTWGDKHSVTAWIAKQWKPGFSTSFRIDAMTQDAIEGQDVQIMGPMQTADPANYGGQRVDAFVGINYKVRKGPFAGVKLAAELGAPVYQNANGVQMKPEYMFAMGLYKAF